MKLQKIHVQGIGPHTDTVLEFDSLPSPVAVSAPCGTGKTFLLEAVLLCLYGRGAWYPGSPYDQMTQGGTGEASIRLWFSQNGGEFAAERILRVTEKTKTSRAMLFEIDAAGFETPIAGPKIGDFENAIIARIGDFETFMATQFYSQNRLLDLCGQPGEPDLAARRRRVFFQLLGVDSLDGIETLAADAQKKTEAEIRVLLAQLKAEDSDSLSTMIAQNEIEIQRTEQEILLARTAQEEAGHTLDAAKRRQALCAGGEAELRATIERHAQAVAAVKAASIRVRDLGDDCEALEKTAGGLEKARRDAEQLEIQRAALRGYEADAEAFVVWQKWEADFQALISRENALRYRISDLEAVPGADEKTRILAERFPSAEVAKLAATDANRKIVGENSQNALSRQSANRELHNLQGELQTVRRRLAQKPETPFGETACAPCPLFQDWAGLADRAEVLKREIDTVTGVLAAIPDDKPLIDLSPVVAACEASKAACAAVCAAQESRKNLETAQGDLRALQSEIETHSASEPTEIEDPAPYIKTTNRLLQELAGAPERVTAAERAAADLMMKRERLEEMRREETTAKSAAADFEDSAQNARQALENRDRERQECEKAIHAAQETLNTLRVNLEVLVTRTASLREKTAGLICRCEERDRKGAEIVRLTTENDALSDLRRCFGPRGVRQILMDNAAPELEAIADDLFEEATGGRMRLRISTQKVLADGSLAEDFTILILDERGERDILRFSGGELTFVQVLFRMATSLWVGRIRGCRPEQMILDEAFDRLGEEESEGTFKGVRIDDLLRALEFVKAQIGQVIVVTHDQGIADRIGSRISLVRNLSGVTVKTDGCTICAT